MQRIQQGDDPSGTGVGLADGHLADGRGDGAFPMPWPHPRHGLTQGLEVLSDFRGQVLRWQINQESCEGVGQALFQR